MLNLLAQVKNLYRVAAKRIRDRVAGIEQLRPEGWNSRSVVGGIIRCAGTPGRTRSGRILQHRGLLASCDEWFADDETPAGIPGWINHQGVRRIVRIRVISEGRRSRCLVGEDPQKALLESYIQVPHGIESHSLS